MLIKLMYMRFKVRGTGLAPRHKKAIGAVTNLARIRHDCRAAELQSCRAAGSTVFAAASKAFTGLTELGQNALTEVLGAALYTGCWSG